MNNQLLYDQISAESCKKITKAYSTSFSLGVFLLGNEIRDAIHGIYGFVRISDEIVDTFHGYDKETLLNEFERDTFLAIERGISTNPVLHSFQQVVNKYKIDTALIDSFLYSMKMDLHQQAYDEEKYKKYIYGSAEVVGLMCLKVFCLGDEVQYEKLKDAALHLGAAFQKVNFLRDLQADYETLGRCYFPNVNFSHFNEHAKKEIEQDIAQDFEIALEGIRMLPINSRLGVYVAYIYYRKLLDKIHRTPSVKVMQARIRIPNYLKAWLLVKSYKNYYLRMY